jgi:hypothetical protein
MAKKIEVIGNYLVLTDTIDNSTIEYPTGRVRYKDTPNSITFTYIDDSSQDNQFEISDILQFDGSPFASTAALIAYLRSNTGFNAASGGSGAGAIGDVKPSMLTEAQMAAIDTSFALCDGRNVTGSAYATLTGNNVIPDLRGQFLRGLDPSGTVDPSGATRTLGDVQTDADQRVQGSFGSSFQGFGSMNASSAFTTSSSTQPRIPSSVGSAQQPTGWDFDNANVIRTDIESRPKNVSVNYFIKIN